MKSSPGFPERTCPRCGSVYRRPPATSRYDAMLFICPECGIREAMDSIGITDPYVQSQIIEMMNESSCS